MSIFGVKRKHVDTSSLRQEISDMRGQTLLQINNLNYGHTELQNMHTELQNIHTELQNTVREMNINHRLLYNKVANILDKNIISIFAESKGALQNGEVFSFGNGAKELDAGYVMNFPGQILGIGLSSVRLKGVLLVVVSINENHRTEYGVMLTDASSAYNNFDKPLRVEAGDIINFVCKNNNSSCVRTVVSMIIELFI